MQRKCPYFLNLLNSILEKLTKTSACIRCSILKTIQIDAECNKLRVFQNMEHSSKYYQNGCYSVHFDRSFIGSKNGLKIYDCFKSLTELHYYLSTHELYNKQSFQEAKIEKGRFMYNSKIEYLNVSASLNSSENGLLLNLTIDLKVPLNSFTVFTQVFSDPYCKSEFMKPSRSVI